MGIKIELPILSLEEANVLATTLENSARQHRAFAAMLHTSQEEIYEHNGKASILETLRERLTGEDNG